jgi:hypothetical protein
MSNQALPPRVQAKKMAETHPPVDRLHQPSPREAALLLLHLLGRKNEERDRPVTRARLSDPTVRRLCGRTRIPNDMLFEVQEILFQAGWVLFWAGTGYAVVKVAVVDGWPRIATKRIRDDLEKVRRGEYDFAELEGLLLAEDGGSADGDDKED